ncbi:MAG TPA: HEAT repeat domain-containing protein [Candidatus Binatia bacterium]|jgi:HEAT repeat protein|nr:HEAT repeat domain-containing protein [Candidatus Binatia bacterium]
MTSRAAARRALGSACAVLLLVLAPAALHAQLAPIDQPGGTTRLRDRYKAPQGSQRLDDNLRKLRGDDPEARLEAIRGLAEANDPKATEALLGAASDPDMAIRVKAIDTLGQMKAKEAIPLLVQQLFMRDTDLGTKRRILAALGKIGDPRATKPILDFLARDVDLAIRGNAIYALGDIGDPAALPTLEALAKDASDPSLRTVAADAIRRINDRPPPDLQPPALAIDQRERRPGRP